MPRPRWADWLPWRWRVFGPILPYDLITSSRRGRWYVLRFLLTGVMLLVLWRSATWFESTEYYSGVSRETAKGLFAQSFYTSFASINITACLLLATTFLGGAIADERRRRLLEFMFATDLTSREIILGKFSSRAYMIAVLLAGSLPILACTMLFGGVEGQWIAQLGLLTITTILCFGGLSVLVSTTIARPRDAVIRSMALTALLILGPLIVGAIFRELRNGPFDLNIEYLWAWLESLNPYRILFYQTAGFRTPGLSTAWDVAIETAIAQSIVGVVALTLAVLTVRRVVVKSSGDAPSKKPLLRPRRFLRPSLGNWPPIFWREAFGEPAVKGKSMVGRLLGALFFWLINLGVVGTWLYAQSNWGLDREGVVYAMGALACIDAVFILLLVGARSAGSVTAEREGDTWTTLLAGPIDSGEIVTGKVMGAVVGFRRFLVPFCLAWFLAGLHAPMEAALRAGVMLFVLLFLAFVNANVGFFFSMRSKSTSAAVVKTIIAVLILGGGYMIPVGLLTLGGSGEGFLTLSQFFLVCYPAFGDWGYSHRWWASVFFAGMMIYLICGPLMYGINRTLFDAFTGRLKPTTPPPRPPTKDRGREGSLD